MLSNPIVLILLGILLGHYALGGILAKYLP